MSFRRNPARAIAVATATGWMCVVVANSCLAQNSSDQGKVARYQLVEEWSVAAQGPVRLREKRVKTSFELDVTDLEFDSAGRRGLKIHFAQAAAEANVPAQGRHAEFDSKKPPQELGLEDHELIGPIALWTQTLRLAFAPDGNLIEISGADGASRRLDEMYDKFLRGSEQDLYTRGIERQKISGEDLRRIWSDVFVGRKSDLGSKDEPLERSSEASFMACIPS